MRTPQSILIILKTGHAQAATCAEQISQWLENRGIRVRTAFSPLTPNDAALTDTNLDMALVLGGDGAMLGAARALLKLNIPLLGVNFGKVGFLADIPAENWQPAMEALLSGHYQEQSHTALAWTLTRHGEKGPKAQGWAINDVVLARGTLARAVSLDLLVDDIFLSRLRCDGLIVSAPLGTTAYAASAHGPLTYPMLDAQVITPISPFAGAFPPLVLPSAFRIRLVAGEEGGEVHLTVDGQETLPLMPGDALTVHGEPGKVRMLVSDPRWYLQRLGERGFILSGPGNYTSRQNLTQNLTQENPD